MLVLIFKILQCNISSQNSKFIMHNESCVTKSGYCKKTWKANGAICIHCRCVFKICETNVSIGVSYLLTPSEERNHYYNIFPGKFYRCIEDHIAAHHLFTSCPECSEIVVSQIVRNKIPQIVINRIMDKSQARIACRHGNLRPFSIDFNLLIPIKIIDEATGAMLGIEFLCPLKCGTNIIFSREQLPISYTSTIDMTNYEEYYEPEPGAPKRHKKCLIM